MAFDLKPVPRARAKQTILEPAIVLEIDGVTTIYGCVVVKKYIRIGDDDLDIGDDWNIGGYSEVEDQSDIITWEGTSTQINQQLLQDKGGTSSASSMQIALLDVGGEATQLISPGVVVEDILGRSARIWLSFKDSAFPEDYIILFQGIISAVQGGSQILLTISSPEVKKNQEVFTKIQTSLDGGINNSVTTITLASVEGLLEPAVSEGLSCYIRIGDELIKYGAIDTGANQLTSCTRGQLGTAAASHSDDDDVESFYRVQGTGLELALKILLSGMDGPWVEDLAIRSFVTIDPSISDVPNAIYFESDVVTKYGITTGSLVTITGATAGANNVSEIPISSIVEFANGVYLVLDDSATLVSETDTAAVASFRSQYDVLGEGAAFGQEAIDVPEFERLIDLFNSAMPDFDFYLKESITVKEFVDTEILFPTGAYSIPRKGKISCGFTSPPLALANLPNIDSTQVVNPNKTTVHRSIGKNFYNAVVYRYEQDVLEDKYLAGRILVDGDSFSQIPIGARPLTITSKGLRNDPATNTILDVNSQRLIERYRFAAELVKAQVQYGVGFQIEVGDVVVYGDNDLLLPDSKFGTREFTPRLMEVVNKSMNIKTGEVSLDLLDTSYLADGRYGVFSPSSEVSSGSTTTTVQIAESFGIDEDLIESDKWRPYIGRAIQIHDDEWNTVYTTVLRGISDSDPHKLLIDAIAAPPSAGWIVDIADYEDSSAELEALPKALHCFWTPQIPVVTGVSGTELTVGVSDAAKILAGAKVIVHDDFVTNTSAEVKVESVVGTTVTLEEDIGFTPDSTYFLDLVGFQDRGPAYRWL